MNRSKAGLSCDLEELQSPRRIISNYSIGYFPNLSISAVISVLQPHGINSQGLNYNNSSAVESLCYFEHFFFVGSTY